MHAWCETSVARRLAKRYPGRQISGYRCANLGYGVPFNPVPFWCFLARNAEATPIARSGSRVESLCRGLSDMDVARAAMGQGWPFAAGPRSDDGTREPRRSRGWMSGLDLLVPFGAMPKGTRSSERNRTHQRHDNSGQLRWTDEASPTLRARLSVNAPCARAHLPPPAHPPAPPPRPSPARPFRRSGSSGSDHRPGPAASG